MNYLLIFVLVVFAGGHVYSYTQVQRLNAELATAKAEIAALSREQNTTAGQLDERINSNAADLDALRASNEESAAAFMQRLDGLEADIREDVSEQMTGRLVQAATSEAVERVVLVDLPKSDSLLMALGSVLAEHFRGELQGVPGEQVDPAVLASLLARNDAFLDAMRFELLAEIPSRE